MARPSAISRRRCRRGPADGSLTWIRDRQAAETAKLAASAITPPTALAACAISPAAPGPATCVTCSLPCSLALPSGRSSAPSSAGRNARYAVAKKTVAVPDSSATMSSWVMVSQPSAAAAGTLAKAVRETRSAVSMMRRRGSRSTQAPAGRPTISHAAAVSTLIASTLACSRVRATSGSGTTEMLLPRLLVVSPSHSSRKSRTASRCSRPLRAGTRVTAGRGRPGRTRRPCRAPGRHRAARDLPTA
jgi:hypothetical protein